MRWLAFGVVLLFGCPRPPTPPPPPPMTQPAVPPDCLAELSGAYALAGDPSWSYEVRDDGGSLAIDAFHAAPVDAGVRPRLFGRDGGFHLRRSDGGAEVAEDAGAPSPPPQDAPAPRPVATLAFTRGPSGFLGEVVSTVEHPGGRSCEARFGAEVVACTDAGLVLAVEPSTALGDTCQGPAHAAQERVRQELLRQ